MLQYRCYPESPKIEKDFVIETNHYFHTFILTILKRPIESSTILLASIQRPNPKAKELLPKEVGAIQLEEDPAKTVEKWEQDWGTRETGMRV